MKNLKIILFSLIVLLVSSCSLTERSDYTLSTQTVFSNEKDAQLALNGCYAYLISYDLYGQQLMELEEGGSGIFYAQCNGGDPDLLASLTFLNSSSYLASVWRGLYKAIANANGVIYGIDHGSLANEAQKTHLKGQALFIRGLCYMNLGQLFEKAPINIDLASQDRINIPPSEPTVVLNQATSDFLNAMDLLADSLTTDPSVPNKTSCNAFLAKTYYYLNDFENAKLYGEKVIGKYQLEQNYAALFSSTLKKTSEDIFMLNCIPTFPDGMGNRLSWIFSPQSGTTGNSWARYVPTKSFFDFFMSKHMYDPRMKAAFLTDSILNVKSTPTSFMWCYPLGINYTKLADPSNPDSTEFIGKVAGLYNKTTQKLDSFNVWTRYTTTQSQHNGWPVLKKTFDAAQTAQLGHGNIRVLRYTDIMLMMADVERKIGEPAKGLTYVNAVLDRARKAGTNGQPLAWALGDLTELNVYHERLFELFGEGFSFVETRRLGLDFFKKEVIDRHDRHKMTIAQSRLKGTPSFYDRLFKDKVADWSQVMKYPVPKTETDKNSGF